MTDDDDVKAANAALVESMVQQLRDCVSVGDEMTLDHATLIDDAADWIAGEPARIAAREDCGQDGVCKLSPGCNRHWEERNRELVRERDEAWAFLRRTAAGGSIVSSAAMTSQQLAIARAAGRMLVMPDGYGFVYVPGPRFCACGRPDSDCDQLRASCPRTDNTSDGAQPGGAARGCGEAGK